MYEYAVKKSNKGLSPYTELIEGLIANEIRPRAFSRVFEKLDLRTDFLLPTTTQELIRRLYQLSREWDDPDETIRTSEADLLNEAKGIIDELDRLEASAWQDEYVIISWAEFIAHHETEQNL